MARSCFARPDASNVMHSRALAATTRRIWGLASALAPRYSWRALFGIMGRVCGALRMLGGFGLRWIRGRPLTFLHISTHSRTSTHPGIQPREPDSLPVKVAQIVMQSRLPPLLEIVPGRPARLFLNGRTSKTLCRGLKICGITLEGFSTSGRAPASAGPSSPHRK